MAVTSATQSVAPPPPKARTPERNRAQEYRAEQEQQQQRAQQNRPKEPVVNTQGQTTGRIVNERA